ncbi:MAG: DUF2341 domain-containing protein, partial [Candidatus Blackburnbacteria bacterium]|nr:DUF2341 domain-containing protein [Candidatus Blackburnbacteria bacterium]
CQDLRFTNTSGKLLPYYIDSGCTTTTTKIWVMVDLVPKNTTAMTIYMYYGNPSAPQGSNSQPYFDNVVGLVGYWMMNNGSGNPSDTSITGNTTSLTVGGSGSQTTTTQAWSNGSSGQYSSSINLDGNDDYVDAGTNTALNPTATGYTITAWFKLANLNSGQWRRIAGRNGSADVSATVNLVFQKASSDKLTIASRDAGNDTASATTTNSLTAGVWYFGAGTFDGVSKQWTIYLIGNGVNETTVGTANSAVDLSDLNSGGQSFYIGKQISSDNSSLLWDGQIDDVKIYNTARTAAQILNDYNNKLPNGQTLTIASTAPTTVIPTTSIPTDANAEKAPSPIAYWKFDDGQGTNAQDSTTNNADGTLAGTTVPSWKEEDLCVSGKCLYFDGSTSKVTVAKVLPSVQTVSIWVRPNTIASIALADFDGGTHTLTTNSSGVVTANGFTSPTYYLNGLSTTTPTLVANRWNHLEVTTGTSFASTASLTLGLSGSTYFKGFMDEVKVYPYARSAAQILADYNSRSNNEGASAQLGSPSTGSGRLADGLIGYWKMDESSGTLADASGNSNTGTWNGTGTSHYTSGKFGNGGGFNGSDDYVSIGSANILPQGTSPFTVVAWINPSNTLSSSGDWFMPIRLKQTTEWFVVFYNNSGSILLWNVFRGNTQWYGTLNNYGTAQKNQWNLYSFVYTGGDKNLSSSYQIYINGSPLAVTANIGTAGGVGNTNEFGRDTNSHYLSGQIDEVRIYNRALSPSEVSSLYNFAPGPKVYLKLDEGTGTAANDSSGNANNGTVNTGTWVPGKYGKGVKVNGTTGSDVSIPDFGY